MTITLFSIVTLTELISHKHNKNITFGLKHEVKFLNSPSTCGQAEILRTENFLTKGLIILATARGGLGRFLGSQWDRQLKFSANSSFLISWSLSKFELIYTTFFFIVSKGGPKEKCWKNQCIVSAIFPLVSPWKLWKKKWSE